MEDSAFRTSGRKTLGLKPSTLHYHSTPFNLSATRVSTQLRGLIRFTFGFQVKSPEVREMYKEEYRSENKINNLRNDLKNVKEVF